MSLRRPRWRNRARVCPHRQAGMALVVVLWLVVLLGMMAAGHARATRTETMLASRQVDVAAARALAAAGIHHVVLEMLTPDLPDPRPVDGTRVAVDVSGEPVVVAVRDVAGLVDLNRAGAGMLELALATCGVAGPRRGEVVAAILDWRDGDSTPGAGGVEDDGYRAAGLPWSARDDAFETVEELRYVIGIDSELFACVAPLVTVRSGRPSVEVAYAPSPLREAMAESGFAYSGQQRSAGPGTYQFVAMAEGERGAVVSIEAVIRLSRDDRNPYQVLEWREPARGGTGRPEEAR